MKERIVIVLTTVAAVGGIFVLGAAAGRACWTAAVFEKHPAPSVPVSGSESALRKDAGLGHVAQTPAASGVLASGPAPDGSAPDAGPRWAVLDESDWPRLVGRWIGDAIPGGPLGGKVVAGGARFEFVKGRPRSKTPWNLTFWLPTSGHLSSTKIVGGCGFYESGVAFCKGYGLPPGQRARETRIAVLREEGSVATVIRVSVTDLFDPVVLRREGP